MKIPVRKPMKENYTEYAESAINLTAEIIEKHGPRVSGIPDKFSLNRYVLRTPDILCIRNLLCIVFIYIRTEEVFIMKNINRLFIRTFIFLISVLLFASCSKQDDGLLMGTWTNKHDALPNGYYVYELMFFNDSAFIAKTSSFGIYTGQAQDDLTAWFEYSGYYSQKVNKLCFFSNKYTFLDTFYGNQPHTIIKDEILFQNCTFKISNNILELNYTTFPADAPVNTVMQYNRNK